MTPTEQQKAAALEALQELHDDCKDNGTWYLKRTMLIRNYILQPTAPVDAEVREAVEWAKSERDFWNKKSHEPRIRSKQSAKWTKFSGYYETLIRATQSPKSCDGLVKALDEISAAMHGTGMLSKPDDSDTIDQMGMAADRALAEHRKNSGVV